MTNDAVVKMVKAGLSDSLIVSMIQSQPGSYTLTAESMVKLKELGVPDSVLAAMVSKGAGGAEPVKNGAVALAPDNAEVPQGLEVGVYFKKGGAWTELLPEVVNWKTGGVLKSVATAGIVKGDVNGRLPGAHSRNSVTSPVEVLVYTQEGIAITEYQLLHLHEHSDSREFRTVTGGVMHVSGGATRDVLPFEGKKIANRMYKVLLPSIGAGEYGFLPPGAITSANSASLGKIYSFRIVE
jgi:hypothetical protein